MFDVNYGTLRKYIPEKNETEVIIPEGVTTIYREAFSCCPILTKVILPSSTRSIEHGAFSDCPCLREIVFNEGFSNIGLNYEGKAVFENCPNLTELELPSTIRHVHLGTSDVKKLNIRSGINVIQKNTFSESVNVEEIVIPQSVTEIGGAAFLDCKSLRTLVLPDGLKELEYMTFWHCESLKEITIPSSVQKIGNDCFNGAGISGIILPNGIEVIAEDTFANCKNLQYIVIPNSVKEIHKSAFWGSGLVCLRIPANVRVVGEGAFFMCDELKNVTICSKETKFVRGRMSSQFAENVQLRGEGYNIPGAWKKGKAVFLAILGGTLLLTELFSFIVISLLVYFYFKKKYLLEFGKAEDTKLIITIIFSRPWYERVPILEGDLPECLIDKASHPF